MWLPNREGNQANTWARSVVVSCVTNCSTKSSPRRSSGAGVFDLHGVFGPHALSILLTLACGRLICAITRTNSDRNCRLNRSQSIAFKVAKRMAPEVSCGLRLATLASLGMSFHVYSTSRIISKASRALSLNTLRASSFNSVVLVSLSRRN